MTLTVWRNRSQVFLFSLWVCQMFSSWLDQGCGFGEEYHRGEVHLSSCQIRGHTSSARLGTCHANLEHLARWCLLGFSAVNSLFSLFTYTLIWKPVPLAHTDGRGSASLAGGGYVYPHYLKFFYKENLLLLLPLFIGSTLHIMVNSCIFVF